MRPVLCCDPIEAIGEERKILFRAPKRQPELGDPRGTFVLGAEVRETHAAREAQESCRGQHGPQGPRVTRAAVDELDEDGR